MSIKWKEFVKLLERYQKGTLSSEEVKIMDVWYDSISREPTSHEEELSNIGQEIWTGIESGRDNELVSGKVGLLTPWWKGIYFRLAAACILLLIAVATFKNKVGKAPIIAGVNNEVIETLISNTNNGTSNKRILLSDGSLVELTPGSTLYFPQQFDTNQRIVFLRGDGYFEIAPNKSKPFFVHANNISTRVVGTSFTIKENTGNKSIEVSVLTGVVEVQENVNGRKSNSSKNKVVLTQNKKATYYERDNQLVKGLIEKPLVIADNGAKEEPVSFIYKEMSFRQILPALEKAYGVNIELTTQAIENCIVTADLSEDTTLFAQLDVLCAAINATYEVNDDTILIKGIGCNRK
ncbi:uncharacterized protein DUF4974 [Dyadobacter jejuensis]|uniref:Uncharacterized protein DUF4974 n=1 Tax=Dyadobacter jejuensis TaxID=1082580 RepID=A0A316AXS9_9BACT|nr:FecR family protein [Dyadobacter jejuensis]PWJ55017.1 uncharacterized protein DUF4974 [Dyadobacter jejuensis]